MASLLEIFAYPTIAGAKHYCRRLHVFKGASAQKAAPPAERRFTCYDHLAAGKCLYKSPPQPTPAASFGAAATRRKSRSSISGASRRLASLAMLILMAWPTQLRGRAPDAGLRGASVSRSSPPIGRNFSRLISASCAPVSLRCLSVSSFLVEK